MIIKKLAGQTLIYGMGTVIPKVINYLLTPYLTYITLTQSDFGVMGYFYAIVPVVFAILLLGLESAYFRFAGKESNECEKQHLFNTLWSSTLLLATVFLALVLLFKNAIYNFMDADFAPSIIWIVALIIFVDVAVSIPFARLREQQRSIRFSTIKALSVVITVLFTIFFYSALPLLKENALFAWMWVEDYGCGYVFVANLIGSFSSMLMILPLARGAKLTIDMKLLRTVLLFSIPLFLGGLAGISNDLLDRFFIEGMLPSDIRWSELGIYTAATKITALMVIFTQMYRYAAEPMFLAKFKNDDFKTANAEVMTFFVIASIAIFLGVTLFLGVFQYIVSEEFRGAMSLVPVMLISAGLMGIFLNLNFWYKYVEKTYFAIIITVSGLIISVLFNLWLIPFWGIEGAAWAKLASMFFMVALSFYFNQKYYPVPYKLWRMAEYTVLAAAIYFVAKYMNIENMVLNYTIRALMFLLFIGYAIKREKILLLLKKK